MQAKLEQLDIRVAPEKLARLVRAARQDRQERLEVPVAQELLAKRGPLGRLGPVAKLVVQVLLELRDSQV